MPDTLDDLTAYTRCICDTTSRFNTFAGGSVTVGDADLTTAAATIDPGKITGTYSTNNWFLDPTIDVNKSISDYTCISSLYTARYATMDDLDNLIKKIYRVITDHISMDITEDDFVKLVMEEK